MTALAFNGRRWNADGLMMNGRGSIPLIDVLPGALHIWDAAGDVVTSSTALDAYWTDGDAGDRVLSVPDLAGERPLARDPGFLTSVTQSLIDIFQPELGAAPLLPGPVWVPSSASFAGRPAWSSDTLLTGNFFFDNIHSALTPHTSRTEEWNYPQSWWGATMFRFPVGVSGPELTLIDGEPGMMTSGWDTTHIEFAAWDSFAPPNKAGQLDATVTGAASDRTYLAMWTVNGARSEVRVVTRDATGTLTETGETGVLGSTGKALTHLHDGWSYTCERTFLAIGVGACPFDDLAAHCESWIPAGTA